MSIRTNQLVNFKGEPYVVKPELSEAIREATASQTMGVTPICFHVSNLSDDNAPECKYIIVPGILQTLFNKSTGVIHTSYEYLNADTPEDANYPYASIGVTDYAGCTRIMFDGFASMDFGENFGDPAYADSPANTFVAVCLTNRNGSVSPMNADDTSVFTA